MLRNKHHGNKVVEAEKGNMKDALTVPPIGAVQAECIVAASQCRKGDEVPSTASNLKQDQGWILSVEVQIGIAQWTTVAAKCAESSVSGFGFRGSKSWLSGLGIPLEKDQRSYQLLLRLRGKEQK